MKVCSNSRRFISTISAHGGGTGPDLGKHEAVWGPILKHRAGHTQHRTQGGGTGQSGTQSGGMGPWEAA